MEDSYLGVIMALGFNFVPRAFGACSGSLLAIAQNTALYSLLGIQFGGDNRVTFGLPDLRGRSAVGRGTGPGLSTIDMGMRFGREYETLNQLNLPMHTHSHSYNTGNSGEGMPATVQVANVAGKEETPTSGDFLAAPASGFGAISANAFIKPSDIPSAGTVAIGGVSGGGSFNSDSLVINSAGQSQPVSINSPRLGINYSICIQGMYPSRS
jgi:microcystin-dependent protein